jgi:hypothetical protein
MGGVVSSLEDAVNDIGDTVSDVVIDPIKDNWVDIRDTAEAAAVVAGNYYLPGSSLLTSNLVTKGAQGQLDSDLGRAANLVAGGTGAYQGNLANYGEIGNAISGGGSAGAGSGEALSGIDLGGPGGSPASWLNAGTGAALGAGALGAGAAGAGAGIGSALSGYAVPGAILGSSLLGANAAKSAADTQADATRQANELIYKMYQEQKGLQEPYRAAGVTAQNRLMDLLGLSENKSAADYGLANKNFAPSDLTSDPSYSFRLGEGLKALDRQAAARGGLISGGALKAAQEYGQQSASQEYQNAFNRYQTNRTNMLQPLGNLITSGQNAAANLGSAAGNYGTNASNNITSGAAANAAGTIGGANALASGVGQYLNYSGNQDLLSTIRQSAYRS